MNEGAIISAMKLMIKKLRREPYGWRSERKACSIKQFGLQLRKLETGKSAHGIVDERRAAKASEMQSFTPLRQSLNPISGR